jgi:NADH-quinone oxidoreductase subunit A
LTLTQISVKRGHIIRGDMYHHFSTVAIFAILATLFIFVTLVAGRFLRPQRPGVVKAETYECGEVPSGPSWINYNMRFYIIALVFVIFDVEAALIFPVAAVFKKWIADGQGLLALVEILLFVAILVVGLIYIWAKKDLEWVKGLRIGDYEV